VFPLTVFMGRTMARHSLTNKRPSGDLLSKSNVGNIMMHVVVAVLYQIFVFLETPLQPGYREVHNPDNGSLTQEATSLFYISSFEFVVIALVRPTSMLAVLVFFTFMFFSSLSVNHLLNQMQPHNKNIGHRFSASVVRGRSPSTQTSCLHYGSW
jgi:hypothetical protein